MSFDIPTQKDFENNSTEALERLCKYIYRIFPDNNDRNGFAGASCWYFWTDWHRLEVFWQQYGEIIKYQQQFKTFCIKCAKEESDYTTTDAVEYAHYKEQIAPKSKSKKTKYRQEGDEEENEKEEENEEKIFSDPLEELIEKEELAKQRNIQTTEQNFIQDQFIEYFDTLSDSIKKEFKLFFMSVWSAIAVRAEHAPTDLPEIARQRTEYLKTIKKDFGKEVSVYQKKIIFLWDCYSFWKFIGDIFGNQWILKDQQQQKSEYKKLSKILHLKKMNSSREKQKLKQVVKTFVEQFLPSKEGEELWSKWERSILKCPLYKELPNLPQRKEVLSEKDKILDTLPRIFCGCSRYKSLLFAITARECGKIDLCHYTDQEIADYNFHKSHCPKCQQAEKALGIAMKYRYGRLSEASNLLVYPKHVPAMKHTPVLSHKKLVSFYEKRYRKIPCDLHKYYLALAYKQNGEIDKAREQLRQTPSKNVAISRKGTVISVYCACCKVEEYRLNASRSPKIALGREDMEDPLNFPQINICEPDKISTPKGDRSVISRDMLTFEYEAKQQDWWVRPKEGPAKKGNLWLLRQEELLLLLERGSLPVGTDWTTHVEQFVEGVYLSDLAGIGIFKTSDNVTFNGKPLEGVSHPLLGKLPFGWYVEITAQRRDTTVVKSLLENSYLE